MHLILLLQSSAFCTRPASALVRGWSSAARSFSSKADVKTPLRICVVGTGPAGFYTADRLLKKFNDDVRVDLVDRLPTPFGLVRSGVAPDHQDTKNVTNQFTAVAKDPRTRFFGNVTLGKDVTLAELRSLYHGVVLAYGAESDRHLGIPGEKGQGVLSAREFVWWYNGHPDMAHLKLNLSRVTSVAVCGIGNVALDCARVLLQPPSELQPTDMAQHALDALMAHSPAVREVHLVARRGPVQAACTPKELKELAGEPGLAVHAPDDQMAVSDADVAAMKSTRQKRRIYDIIKAAAAKTGSAEKAARHLHFQFYRQPKEVVLDAEGRVAGLRVERTALREGPGGQAVAVGTGVYDTIPAQLVLVSIGYKSLPVEGAPFDRSRGIIPNVAGRVLDLPKSDAESTGAAASSESSSGTSTGTVPGLYVCGWLKRGPTGIIGTNAVDAEETVGSIAEDVAAGALGSAEKSAAGGEGLRTLLQQRGVRVVDFKGWLRIDRAEVLAGEQAGRVRQKVVEVKEMLRLAEEN